MAKGYRKMILFSVISLSLERDSFFLGFPASVTRRDVSNAWLRRDKILPTRASPFIGTRCSVE